MGDLTLLMVAGGAILLLFSLTFMDRIRPLLIYSMPALNALAAVLVMEGENAGKFHMGIVRVLVMLGLILIMMPSFRLDLVTSSILVFVVYMLILVPGATEPMHSFQGVLKPAVSLLMFPIGYVFFRQLDQLRRLHWAIIAAVAVLMTNFALAQVFKFGQSPYAEDVNVGEGAVTMAYIFAYTLLMMPLIFRFIDSDERVKRIVIGLLLFSSFVVMLLIFRRGALLGLASGLALYTTLSPAKRAVRLLKFGLVGAMLFALSSSYYLDTIQRLFEERGDVAAFVSNTERGRMAEFGNVTERILDGSLEHALFGEEPFNSRRYLGTGRSLHVDYMNLLFGTGFVGLFLYLWIHAVIAWSLVVRARRSRLGLARELRDIGLALMVASLTISFSTQIYMIASLSILFLYLGALVGVLTGARAEPVSIPEARGLTSREAVHV